jgi:hypothetical protein
VALSFQDAAGMPLPSGTPDPLSHLADRAEAIQANLAAADEALREVDPATAPWPSPPAPPLEDSDGE